jgi:hypothetical protein
MLFTRGSLFGRSVGRLAVNVRSQRPGERRGTGHEAPVEPPGVGCSDLLARQVSDPGDDTGGLDDAVATASERLAHVVLEHLPDGERGKASTNRTFFGVSIESSAVSDEAESLARRAQQAGYDDRLQRPPRMVMQVEASSRP